MAGVTSTTWDWQGHRKARFPLLDFLEVAERFVTVSWIELPCTHKISKIVKYVLFHFVLRQSSNLYSFIMTKNGNTQWQFQSLSGQKSSESLEQDKLPLWPLVIFQDQGQ